MKHRVGFTRRDMVALLACMVFVLCCLGAVGATGRSRAKEAVCLSNVMQWGRIWKIYTDDHDGLFPERGSGTDCGEAAMVAWPHVIWEYVPKLDWNLCLCPVATKRYDQGARAPWAAWNTDPGCPPVLVGSYGVNLWVSSAKNMEVSRDPAKFWQSPYVKGSSHAPLMLDCIWKDIESEPYDAAPPYNGYIGIAGEEMHRACINRHGWKNDVGFLDLSARPIQLKYLWQLRWHKKWPSDGFPDGGWPEWMENLKDY
jgi:hypothetical protein